MRLVMQIVAQIILPVVFAGLVYEFARKTIPCFRARPGIQISAFLLGQLVSISIAVMAGIVLGP